jgi:aspartate/methionine/tyrosine aminotransferase
MNKAAINEHERVKSSDYMHWAKTQSGARFNLASSGVMNRSLSELNPRIEDLEITCDAASLYGYKPLLERIGARYGVPVESIVEAGGTSMANHLAIAAAIEPGDEVLIEHPTYELILLTARYIGARVKKFSRKFEEDFRIQTAEIEKQITHQTRLVIITNLHNPSSALTDDETLKRIGALARERGARVLVDEVYLDAAFSRAPQTAFRLGDEFIVTSSLTKVYGLSGLRCGWIFAEPKLAQKIRRLNDLFGSVQPHATQRLSCIAFDHLDEIAAESRALLERNRAILNDFFASCAELETAPLEFGTVAFPRLRRGNADDFCALLRERYETSVVPGSFFEMPENFRIGIACETEMLKEGLERIGAAVKEFD